MDHLVGLKYLQFLNLYDAWKVTTGISRVRIWLISDSMCIAVFTGSSTYYELSFPKNCSNLSIKYWENNAQKYYKVFQ